MSESCLVANPQLYGWRKSVTVKEQMEKKADWARSLTSFSPRSDDGSLQHRPDQWLVSRKDVANAWAWLEWTTELKHFGGI